VDLEGQPGRRVQPDESSCKVVDASMGFYNDRVLPFLIDVSMRQEPFKEYRRRLIGGAEGRVLEIGVGSGLNLPFYPDAARHVIGLDLSPRLLSMTRQTMQKVVTATDLLEASAERIPLAAKSVDTVVTTWTLCSVPDVMRSLEEMRRVLKPSGQLLFVEHGRSPDRTVSGWQDRVTPLWKRVAGGCHLNRPIAQLIESSGFRIEYLDSGYMKGPKLMTFMYEGRARST
jgi:ubiquinone/menaquinone biosynthesis C-methylase UbiE